jgi:hypothetical protein
VNAVVSSATATAKSARADRRGRLDLMAFL